MIVILGELGGQDEYGVVEALKAGAITKPVVGQQDDGFCALCSLEGDKETLFCDEKESR